MSKNQLYIAPDLVAPDYVALARAFGAEGAYADGPDALSEALSVALQRKRPTLIEVPLSPKTW